MDEYSRHQLKIAVANVCLSLGWTSVHSTPLDVLTDILQDYMRSLGRISCNYANLYNVTEPNLEHLALAFKDMNVNISDLEEYVAYIDGLSVPEVPQYPVPRESNLNFLKPGSREVVTRPVHVHEHLPPMHPHLEEESEFSTASDTPSPSSAINDTNSVEASARPHIVFKRPNDPAPELVRRVFRSVQDEEIRPLREISSVMMTTSGFLSHAREGKLPEARSIPFIQDVEPEVAVEPKCERTPSPSVEVKPEKKKKNKDISKKTDKENKNKDETTPLKEEELKVKKLTHVKETTKLKPLKTGALKLSTGVKNEKKHKNKRAGSPGGAGKNKAKSPKFDKRLASPSRKECVPEDLSLNSDVKLSSEPDPHKLNIFKKIPKIKDEHDELKMEAENEPSTSRALDEFTSTPKKINPRDDVVDVDNDLSLMGVDSMPYVDDPSLPATPRTPDVPRVTEHKKKKKDKHKDKREHDKYVYSPRGRDEFPLGKPKTPEGEIWDDDMELGIRSLPAGPALPPSLPTTFPFLGPYPSGPGLIPHPLNHPLIPPHMTLPLMNHYSPSTRLPSSVPCASLSAGLSMPAGVGPKEAATPPVSISPLVPAPISSPSLPPPLSSTKIPIANAPTPSTPTFKKKDKKDKKNKEKLKKKKEKKEKYKSKDKSERKKLKMEKKERDKDKTKQKKEKKEKKKDKEHIQEEKIDPLNAALPKITFKLGSLAGSPQDANAEPCHRKIVIKPVLKKDDDVLDAPRPPAPDQVRLNATSLKTKTHKSHKSVTIEEERHTPVNVGSQIAPQPVIHTNENKEGENQVWICPACGRPDDGSPMIACDTCDLWFHWICVGIQEAPESDWYCQKCVAKKDDYVGEKKKKHKKKKSAPTQP